MNKSGKKALFLILGIISIMLIAAGCGGDSEEGPAQRAQGTTAVEPTPVTPLDTAVPAPIVEDTPDASAPTSGSGDGGSGLDRGQTVFNANGCTGCHTIEGVPGAVGNVGPELTHVATNAPTRKGTSAEEYLRESVEDPAAFVVEGFSPIMPSLRGGMSDEEFEDLIAFLLAQE